MTEFFQMLPPDEAWLRWWPQVSHRTGVETVSATQALGRITAQAITSPSALPAFRRTSVDGYAVRAADTFGASDTLPAYLHVVGEVLMGQPASVELAKGDAALIHTGGMLPDNADAVVMIEHTQVFSGSEIEVRKPAAPGENVIQVGEDVQPGEQIVPARHRVLPQDVGALLALGLVNDIPVARRPRISLFSTGDELVSPDTPTLIPGQVRDINSSTIQMLSTLAEAEVPFHFLIPDKPENLYQALSKALPYSDMLVVTAGSSVSVRDTTAETINRLGSPGVLVHGLAVRPGKPTILAVVDGKPVIGLPGNPVSSFVQFMLFGVRAIAGLMGADQPRMVRVKARAAANVPSVAGREDYVPVRLLERDGEQWAEPAFGKSNLIFTLVGVDGLLKVPLNVTGLQEGTWAEVLLF
ncbi:MAG: molybdopterin molybdotransferase MoeA [Chloroflexi bacterium]|nr:molybdopterin molybdotransferase MoeA [Chloroflexota bacterium]